MAGSEAGDRRDLDAENIGVWRWPTAGSVAARGATAGSWMDNSLGTSFTVTFTNEVTKLSHFTQPNSCFSSSNLIISTQI
jgi:hypothetical protein